MPNIPACFFCRECEEICGLDELAGAETIWAGCRVLEVERRTDGKGASC